MARNRDRARRRNEERAAINAQKRLAQVLEAAGADPAPARRPRSMTQLQLLEQRGAIDERQMKAGERLYRDFHTSGSEPRITPRYVERSLMAPSRDDRCVRRAAAHQSFVRAVQAVGITLSPVLIHVCITDGSATAWARDRGLPAHDGPARLRAGLEALAAFYRKQAPRDDREQAVALELAS